MGAFVDDTAHRIGPGRAQRKGGPPQGVERRRVRPGAEPLPELPSWPQHLAPGLLSIALALLLLLGIGLVLVGHVNDADWPVVAGLLLIMAGAAGLLVRLVIAKRRLSQIIGLLTGALEGQATGQLICDSDGQVVFVNAAFRSQIGWAETGNAATRRPMAALIRQFSGDAESKAGFQTILDRLQAGRGTSVELAVPRDGANQEWWRVQAQPVEGYAGAAYWRIEDITAWREIDVIMRHEQAKLADFMDHAPVGFFSVDQDGRFLLVNGTLANWLGTSIDVLIEGDRTLHDILANPPSRGTRAFDLFDGGGENQRGDLTLRGLDGRQFQAFVAQTVVLDEESGLVHTRAVVRDLTPEHEWQEALRVSEQRFLRIFEDAPIGVALADDQGALVECNEAFAILLGVPADRLVGQPVKDLIRRDDRPMLFGRLAEVQAGDVPVAPLELRLDGPKDRTVQVYARRLDGIGIGGGKGLILHFIDMTERKSLEAQFAQSQKMQAIGQLAGGVAHDFNNLLTGMIGFCDLLLLRHKPGDYSFTDIMQIKQNANRAANLVRQLLAFSRQQTLQPRVMNVDDAVVELVNLLRRLIGENIELKMSHGADAGMIKVDQNQFEQVIINLVVNARDAMPTGGRLSLVTGGLRLEREETRGTETIPPGDYVTIAVSDTGCGIRPENLARLFEPFFTTKPVGSGTGLGLSTVYGIVRQTGGFIVVESEPGEGSVFTLLIPRHRGLVQAPEPTDGRDRRVTDLSGSGIVLLVEDEDAVRIFSSRALQKQGYQVLEAKNGEAALEVITSGTDIDLMITDVVMPQMDGPTLVRHVRERLPNMKVIFISGYAEDRLGDVDGEEVSHFLPKPFSMKQLASKVKEVMSDDQASAD